MLPEIFRDNLFDDFMRFPYFPEFEETERKHGKSAHHLMRTDVKEHDDKYELMLELPGFKKDEINVKLENGYLTVAAERSAESEENDKKGKPIRTERYHGRAQRSFYVGDAVTEEDIGAKFENGVLTLCVAKKDPEKLTEHKTIQIEG